MLRVQRLLTFLLLPFWISCGGVDQSNPLPSSNTSILCHVVEMQMQNLLPSVTNKSTNESFEGLAFDHDLMCETTLPLNHYLTVNNNDTTTTAMWIYTIKNLSQDMRQDLMLDQYSRDQTWIRFSNVHRNDPAATLEVVPNATITFVTPPSDMISATALAPTHSLGPTRHRKLTSTSQGMGTSNVLVVRVTWLDIAPDVTADELRGRIFGMGRLGDRDFNLRRQLESCSFGKLLLQPAPPVSATFCSPDSPSIDQGILEMQLNESIPLNLLNNSVKLLENMAMQRLVGNGGNYLHDQVNNILIVLPQHPDIRLKSRRFLAYAYPITKLSVYSNYWATSVSVLSHELGHNYGLAHAGEEELPYGDTSGTMGYGMGPKATNQFCFNAQKNWFLRWYEDRAMTLSVMSGSPSMTSFDGVLPWTGTLASFVDYDRTSLDQPVLLRIQSDDQEKRLYLQYNRAKAFNEGSREYRDQVVIVEDTGSLLSRRVVQSWLVAAISPPPVGMTSNRQEHLWNTSDFASMPINIQVCHQGSRSVDFVLVSIFPDGEASGCAVSVDECNDKPDVRFQVNVVRGEQSCEWLNGRPIWQAMLCKPGSEAWEYCRYSCNNCAL